MRSRRQSLKAIMRPKATTKMSAIKKNMRALTPPKKRMPMAMTAITMKPPISGSASSSKPTMATASAMGETALKKCSLTSILRTM